MWPPGFLTKVGKHILPRQGDEDLQGMFGRVVSMKGSGKNTAELKGLPWIVYLLSIAA